MGSARIASTHRRGVPHSPVSISDAMCARVLCLSQSVNRAPLICALSFGVRVARRHRRAARAHTHTLKPVEGELGSCRAGEGVGEIGAALASIPGGGSPAKTRGGGVRLGSNPSSIGERASTRCCPIPR
jgi:hypothetical protein